MSGLPLPKTRAAGYIKAMETLQAVDGGQIMFVIPHLKGADMIARVFGVSRVTVVQWIKSGAPICLVGKKYQANYANLWSWLESQSRQVDQLSRP